MTPFREAAASPSKTAIARLAARRAHPVRAACATLVSYREVARADARPAQIASATARGFVYLGCAAESVIPPVYRKQVFVDAERTTQLQLSARGYYFSTYFESGRCILTWDHTPKTPSTDLLESRATAGSFDADYDAHLEAVAAASTNDAPIVVADLADAVALGRIYYRGVVPLPLAATTVLSLFVLPIAFVVAVLEVLRGMHR